jgi:arginase family enzyme
LDRLASAKDPADSTFSTDPSPSDHQLSGTDDRGSGGYNVPLDTNPFNSWATVIDCGDIRVTSYDNAYALRQIEEGHHSVLSRGPATNAHAKGPAKGDKTLPRIITLGGDHTITLPLLRSINRAYGPVSVIHFDSHLDTCKFSLLLHPSELLSPPSNPI